MSTGLVILGSFAFAALIVSGIADLIISRNKKRKPMATMNGKLYVYTAGTITTPDTYADSVKVYPNPEAIKRAAVDANQPDDAIFTPKTNKQKLDTAMKAPIIPKGWKRHDGGNRPVSMNTRVDVMWNDGIKSRAVCARTLYWPHLNQDATDIIAYRIVKPKPAVKKAKRSKK